MMNADTEFFYVVTTVLLVLILVGIQKLIKQIQVQSANFRDDLARLNDQMLDIRTRLRDSDFMTDDEREEWDEQQRADLIGSNIRPPLF
ncbi:MAG: hypothetical protein WAX67_07920 [Rugosibacter sp.]